MLTTMAVLLLLPPPPLLDPSLGSEAEVDPLFPAMASRWVLRNFGKQRSDLDCSRLCSVK